MVLIAKITAPEEGLVYSTRDIQLKINEKIIGKGLLYISQGALAWQASDMEEGISIQWKQISVHGVSTNPSKCIYFMLDHKLEWRNVYESTGRPAANGRANGDGAAGGAAGGHGVAAMDQQDDCEEDEGNVTDEGEDEDMTECWLLPDDVNTVDTMFQAMKECQALHPDPADSVSEESDFMDDDGEDGNNLVGNGNGADADAAQDGIHNLNLNDDQFADADE